MVVAAVPMLPASRDNIGKLITIQMIMQKASPTSNECVAEIDSATPRGKGHKPIEPHYPKASGPAIASRQQRRRRC